MRYAFIDENNKVRRVIEADEEFASAHNNTITSETVDPLTLVAVADSVNKGWQRDSVTNEFTAPEPDDSGIAARIRAERDALLDDSDWTQNPDAPVDQGAWAVYRQALRDIPQQENFPFRIIWPNKPQLTLIKHQDK